MPPAHRHALCWHCMRTALNTDCARTPTVHRHRYELRIDLSPRASADDCRAARCPAPRALPAELNLNFKLQGPMLSRNLSADLALLPHKTTAHLTAEPVTSKLFSRGAGEVSGFSVKCSVSWYSLVRAIFTSCRLQTMCDGIK
ncbi:PREDICTED: uncharacterized protein LOC106101164 [Papilio polytes]|uniref:uncharacterized protein LOC106101164 n=1 Tax=Papilio polytes TaxID=76194 RepID=UPI000675F241|nr:PREDICTED: uncharacterized protein LOC106101164 [Papilio polytes]